MLDYSKLTQALQRSQLPLKSSQVYQNNLGAAYSLWSDSSFQEKIQELGTKLYEYHHLSEKKYYTLCAVDGSQIYPDQHRGTSCHLINIAQIILSYQAERSSFTYTTLPFIYADRATAAIINIRRALLELQQGLTANKNNNIDLVLLDGPLSLWDEQHNPESAAAYNQTLACYAQLRIPIVGYLSAPASHDIVDLMAHSAKLLDKKIDLETLTDIDIVSWFLPKKSYSTLLSHRNSPDILFCYCHNGFEIVRLEFPAWLAEQRDQLQAIIEIIVDQVMKGAGYPVALSEAHEQAVVREVDRQYFYQLLVQEYGLIRPSYKYISKQVVRL